MNVKPLLHSREASRGRKRRNPLDEARPYPAEENTTKENTNETIEQPIHEIH